ncbi:MAG: methionine adenosyltransferase [Chromatiaceae bacterium]|jgi:S-adenosylmethionine synthetase
MSDDFVFTSESMTAGHPDKLCDQVSDAIVDHYLMQDPNARIVAESVVASGVMFISTHFASPVTLDITDIARQVVREIGYPKDIFDADACTIMTSFSDHTATDYVALDFDKLTEEYLDRLVSKHQVTVFGYACTQTPDLMPLPIWLAHKLAAKLDSKEVKKALPYLLPDAKAQVGVEYHDCKPTRVHSITLVASQSDPDIGVEQLRSDLLEEAIEPVFKKVDWALDGDSKISVNPEGLLIGGGPSAHSGLTGRKTGVDSYGEFSRHNGAALSGKDPLRIDRVGAYAARYVAKNLVAAGLAEECEVVLSYAVGVAGPVSVRVRTFGTGKLAGSELVSLLNEHFDLRLGAIVRDFGLTRLPSKEAGFYQRLACYGHMGRKDIKAPWEATDRAARLT